MTGEQFTQRQAEILAKVPISFHAATASYAWANGHANGYESVLEILAEVVDEVLLPSLENIFTEVMDGILLPSLEETRTNDN